MYLCMYRCASKQLHHHHLSPGSLCFSTFKEVSSRPTGEGRESFEPDHSSSWLLALASCVCSSSAHVGVWLASLFFFNISTFLVICIPSDPCVVCILQSAHRIIVLHCLHLLDIGGFSLNILSFTNYDLEGVAFSANLCSSTIL